jgi:hypothetical protein
MLLQLAGFEMQVLGREFPELHDYWDGNWLLVKLEYKDKNSMVRAKGPIVHLSELVQLEKSLNSICEGFSKSEKIEITEPELRIAFRVESAGHVQFELELTPDNAQQGHWYFIEVDLGYLSETLSQCRAILKEYPIREPRDLS